MFKVYYYLKIWKLKRDIEFYLEFTGKFNDHKMRELADCLSKLKIQTTFIYCPECHNELIGSNSYKGEDKDLIAYECTNCDHISKWSFDIAPIPILIDKEKEK